MVTYLALGYDTERPYGKMASTIEGEEFRKRKIAFVDGVFGEVLDNLQAPRTHFMLGHFLEQSAASIGSQTLRKIFRVGRGLVEIGQHSYSHPVFRATIEGDVNPISIDEFIVDVKSASEVVEGILGVKPLGLRTPRGYDCDLSDVPRLAQGLVDIGLEYVSSNLRGKDSLCAPFVDSRQPKSYEHVGVPGLVEIPSHGNQDVLYLDAYAHKLLGRGAEDSEKACLHYSELIDLAVEMSKKTTNPVAVCLCLHPWAVMSWDPKMEAHTRLIEHARSKGTNVVSYGTVNQIFRKGSN